MGVISQPLHRRLAMRIPFTRLNSFAKACVGAVVILMFLAVALQSDSSDFRRSWLRKTRPPVSSGTFRSKPPLLELANNATPSWNAALSCNDDLDHLRRLKERYGLADQFEYFKRHVVVSREDIKRKSLTELKQSFAPQTFRVVDTTSTYAERQTCLEPLEVHVSSSPFPSTANLSDFMFGVSTTYARFNDPKTSPVKEWSYWLTDSAGNSNGGKLVLLLVNATHEELTEAAAQLGAVGIDADVYRADPEDIMAVRYMSLVPAMYKQPERVHKKWLVVCDDDTFFPSPHALVETLGEMDPSQELYVGTLSEDINNVQRHGSQAFGGAGVFISVPLARRISELFPSCSTEDKINESNSGWGPQGDIILRKCIYENTAVRLTNLGELWQIDLTGDPSGFYESGMRPLSLHHYRGGFWPVAHPFEYTKVSHLCGEDCMMQRFRTADDWVISTSFSVVNYPRGMDGLNMRQLERTFAPAPDDKGWNFDYTFGPQRESLLRTGRKISWDLQESTVEMHANGRMTVSQVYVRKQSDPRWVDQSETPMSRHDGIIELVWVS
ncbi:hypothetical protein MGG_11486 [Pyricularia oryzae 70-15]|uniref:Fringe-like glycosyltransferase domain-containing protein n=5 Tax=Pyricularia TaxID=48558 RepID=G4NE31_PYRO7|nr:uncharacterized protein MGG_11486 [Pyricularia oryzae 70-15]EHA48566.1 hypothetical protein MGG_11486 [Pyricularia oryzae 70-15]KAI7912601.1 hypothetical protein M9X92_009916 [Pyricularia oryzae]KAI7920743.1 hypothetical protein M0657_006436 [Pyricularia oryzae]QBZ62388.1 hypothetical protein PoMZ_11268 [Pyricularia oryzae]